MRAVASQALHEVEAALVSGRWTSGRKEGLLVAIQAGEISEVEALARYGISHDELAAWRRGFARRGRGGLLARGVRR